MTVDNDIQEIVSLRIPWSLVLHLQKEAGARGVSYLDLIRAAIFAAYPQFANSNFNRRMERAARISGIGDKWEYCQEDADHVTAAPSMGVGAKIVKGTDNE